MAKKNSRNGRKASSSQSQSQSKSRQSSGSRQTGIAATFDDATTAVTNAYNRVPANAFYWGLGALALGAAAVGAYMYRERLVELYDETLEYLDSDDSTSSTKSVSSRLAQLDPH